MADIARRSLLAGISAAPAAVVAATLPTAVLAHPIADHGRGDADAGLIAQAALVIRLARLKDHASHRLARREETALNARPAPPSVPMTCAAEEQAVTDLAYVRAVTAWQTECARLRLQAGTREAEDLNGELFDRLETATEALAALVAETQVGAATKARAYLDLVTAHGCGSDEEDDWIAKLAISVARDAVLIGR